MSFSIIPPDFNDPEAAARYKAQEPAWAMEWANDIVEGIREATYQMFCEHHGIGTFFVGPHQP